MKRLNYVPDYVLESQKKWVNEEVEKELKDMTVTLIVNGIELDVDHLDIDIENREIRVHSMGR